MKKIERGNSQLYLESISSVKILSKTRVIIIWNLESYEFYTIWPGGVHVWPTMRNAFNWLRRKRIEMDLWKVGLDMSFSLSSISRFLERFLIKHKSTKNSLHSELQVSYTCSIRISSRKRGTSNKADFSPLVKKSIWPRRKFYCLNNLYFMTNIIKQRISVNLTHSSAIKSM